MEKLRVEGKKFINEPGREVLLQGINFVCKEKEQGYLFPEHKKLFAWFAGCGFNLVRLGIFWDAAEPKPGIYDEAYLEKIRRVIQDAEKENLYVMVDMHQDLWSVKYGDGAPEWATITDGGEHPSDCAMWFDAYLRSEAIINAAEHFWKNDKAEDGVGLMDHYALMWEHIAEKLCGCRNVIGFEPMNEPFMGNLARVTFGIASAKTTEKYPEFNMATMQGITPESQAYMSRIIGEAFMEFDRNTLMPFYQKMNDAIRKKTGLALITGGNIYCSANFPTGIGRVAGADGQPESQQIYAPHGYDSVVDSDRYENFSKENVENLFADKKATQEQLGMPVIVGEWGAFPSKDFTKTLLEHMNQILEKYLWSSAYWQYLPGMEEDSNYDALKRAYPVETEGKLIAYHYDSGEKELEVTWTGTQVLCFVPFEKPQAVGGNGIEAEIVREVENGVYVKLTAGDAKERTVRVKEEK
ncbi:MAG: cellulase family glycosylhydrolase [Eubacteriales bacterium]|nr:cellulase family glycosylhydrolase [Eubacteriales bacterium]